MDSLTQLNNYSNMPIATQDDRPPSIVFSNDPTARVVNVFENATFKAAVPFTLSAIYSQTYPLEYRVILDNSPDTTIDFGTLPDHIHVTKTGVIYSVTGMRTNSNWLQVLNATFTMPANPQTWTFMSEFKSEFVTKVWSTTVVVKQLEQLSAASTYKYPGGPDGVVGTPQILDLGPGTESDSYTVTMTIPAGVGTVSGAGWTLASNVLTTTGSFAAVNIALNSLAYSPLTNFETTWSTTYTLINHYLNFTSTVTQQFVAQAGIYLSPVSSFYYRKNVMTPITGAPTVTDTVSPGGTTYTLEVSAIDPAALLTLASPGHPGTWDNVNKKLTVQGSKININAALSQLQFTPSVDYAELINLKYKLIVSTGEIAVRIQIVYFDAASTSLTNLAVNRQYTANLVAQPVFASQVPQIVEEVLNATYMITLTSSAGRFGYTESSIWSPFAMTGTKAEINNLLSQVKFWPNYNVTGSQTITLYQSRDGSPLNYQDIVYVGVTNPNAVLNQVNVTLTASQQFNLTYEQANYLKMDLLVQGGGGGMGGKSSHYNGSGYSYEGGGGGGGGGVAYITGCRLAGTSSLAITMGTQGVTADTAFEVRANNGTAGTLTHVESNNGTLDLVGYAGTGGQGAIYLYQTSNSIKGGDCQGNSTTSSYLGINSYNSGHIGRTAYANYGSYDKCGGGALTSPTVSANGLGITITGVWAGTYGWPSPTTSILPGCPPLVKIRFYS